MSIYIPSMSEIESHEKSSNTSPIMDPKSVTNTTQENIFKYKTQFIERVQPAMVNYMLSLKKGQLLEMVWTNECHVDQSGITLKKGPYVNGFLKYLTEVKKQGYRSICDYEYSKGCDSGRLYVNEWGLQRCQKLLKGALAPNDMMDIDMKNAHPCILYHLARTNECSKHIELPFLKEYIMDRDLFLSDITETKIDKRFILTQMNKDKHRLYDFKTKKVRSLILEFNKIKNALYSKYSDLIETDNKRNPVSSVINKLICQKENEILQKAVNFSIEQGHVVESLLFDGFHVKLDSSLENVSDFIESLNELTKSEGIRWDSKEFDRSIKIPEDFQVDSVIVPESDRYEARKIEFEKNHFVILNPFTFVKEYNGATGISMAFYNKSNFADLTAPFKYTKTNSDGTRDGEDVPILPRWISDETRKSYVKMDFQPPPLNQDPEVYNLFKGFEYKSWDPKDCEYTDKTDITVFLDHIRLLSGSDKTDDVYNYLLHWFSHLIQKPGELPEVALVFKSVQGVGKNLFFESFARVILGDQFLLSTADQSHITSRFADLRGKLMVIADECGKNIFENTGQLKALITNRTIISEQKGLQPMPMHNSSRIVSFSNCDVPVVVEQQDRRYMCVEITDSPKNEDYFQRLADAFKDKSRLMKFIDYMLGVDLNKFTFRNRPITSYYKFLQQGQTPNIDKYLDVYLSKIPNESGDEIKVSANDFYQSYRKWLKKRSYTKPPNRGQIGRDLHSGYLNHGFYSKKVSCMFYFFNKEKIYKHMIETGKLNRDFTGYDSREDQLEMVMSEKPVCLIKSESYDMGVLA